MTYQTAPHIHYDIFSITKDPGTLIEASPRFLVEVHITIRHASEEADMIRINVSLPFDESATYGQIERDAINAALCRVNSIRDDGERHS